MYFHAKWRSLCVFFNHFLPHARFWKLGYITDIPQFWWIFGYVTVKINDVQTRVFDILAFLKGEQLKEKRGETDLWGQKLHPGVLEGILEAYVFICNIRDLKISWVLSFGYPSGLAGTYGWCTIYQVNSKSWATSQRTQQWSLSLTQ